MARSVSRYILRRPRHAAASKNGFPVVIRPETEPDGPRPAVLLDLSREGFCLRAPAAMQPGSGLSLEFPLPRPEPTVTWRATVRWARAQADGGWLLGCRLEQPLSWETLGELFLHDVLDSVILSAAKDLALP